MHHRIEALGGDVAGGKHWPSQQLVSDRNAAEFPAVENIGNVVKAIEGMSTPRKDADRGSVPLMTGGGGGGSAAAPHEEGRTAVALEDPEQQYLKLLAAEVKSGGLEEQQQGDSRVAMEGGESMQKTPGLQLEAQTAQQLMSLLGLRGTAMPTQENSGAHEQVQAGGPHQQVHSMPSSHERDMAMLQQQLAGLGQLGGPSQQQTGFGFGPLMGNPTAQQTPLVPPSTYSGTSDMKQTAVVDCPKRMVGRVIGKGGETIKALQQYTGAMIQIDQSTDPTRVTIAGSPRSLYLAVSMVTDIVRGTFKGFAMLRQIAMATTAQHSMGNVGQTPPQPMYVQGYGFVPPSQALGATGVGASLEDLSSLGRLRAPSPQGPITPPVTPLRSPEQEAALVSMLTQQMKQGQMRTSGGNLQQDAIISQLLQKAGMQQQRGPSSLHPSQYDTMQASTSQQFAAGAQHQYNVPQMTQPLDFAAHLGMGQSVEPSFFSVQQEQSSQGQGAQDAPDVQAFIPGITQPATSASLHIAQSSTLFETNRKAMSEIPSKDGSPTLPADE